MSSKLILRCIKLSTRYPIAVILMLSLFCYPPKAFALDLAWESSDSSTVEYYVHRWTGDPCQPDYPLLFGPYDHNDQKKTQRVSLADPVNDTKFYFAVTAVDGNDNESDYSNIIYAMNDEWGNATCRSESSGTSGGGGGCFMEISAFKTHGFNGKLIFFLLSSLGLMVYTISRKLSKASAITI